MTFIIYNSQFINKLSSIFNSSFIIHNSPLNYVYCANNPVMFVDPDGCNTFYYSDSNTYQMVDTPWYIDLFFGDTYYVKYLDGDTEFNGSNYIEADCKASVIENTWSKVMELTDEEATSKIFTGTKGIWNNEIMKATQVKNRSQERGDMDYKQKLDQKSIYVVGNKAYNRNQIGNMLWGASMHKLGYEQLSSNTLAHAATFIKQYTLDESHDQNAIKIGWGCWNPKTRSFEQWN